MYLSSFKNWSDWLWVSETFLILGFLCRKHGSFLQPVQPTWFSSVPSQHTMQPPSWLPSLIVRATQKKLKLNNRITAINANTWASAYRSPCVKPYKRPDFHLTNECFPLHIFPIFMVATNVWMHPTDIGHMSDHPNDENNYTSWTIFKLSRLKLKMPSLCGFIIPIASICNIYGYECSWASLFLFFGIF